MTKKKTVPGQLITGAGGVLLILSLFLPWAAAGGTHQTGFELLRIGDVFLVVAGLVAVAAALTWKHYGLFRPDLALTGAIAIAAGVGDYSTLRGAPLFPRIDAASDPAARHRRPR